MTASEVERHLALAALRKGNGIVVVVNLPQPLGRISDLLSALGQLWPGTMVNYEPDPDASKLGNWLIEVEADDG